MGSNCITSLSLLAFLLWKEIKKYTKKKSKSAECLFVNDFFIHFSNVFETQSETNGTRSHVDKNPYDEMLDYPVSLE